MSTTEGPGGGGSPNADKLSLEQMIAIAKADKSNNERTREQAEGAKLAEEVLADMHRVLSKKTKELKKNFSSPADSALYNSLDRAIPSLKDASTSAGDLKSVLNDTADTVDRNYEKMSAYEKEQSSLESTDPQDLKQFADPGTGEDGYTTLANDILTDARNDFRTEDDKFLTHKMDISSAHPEEYVGPEWQGREPRFPPSTFLDDYYPDDSPYGRGGSPNGFSSNASQPGGNPSSSTPGSSPDAPPTNDSPELQNPGGPNAPVTTTPGPTGPGTPPPTGGNPPPAPFVPGGSNPTNLPGRTVSQAPLGQRPITGNPTARPTPGMSRPVTAPQGRGIGPNATGRPTSPMAGRGGYNAVPKNSMLPNQRQAASGRNPVTGSGRIPNGTNATNPRGGNAGARGGVRSGPTGVTARKPHSGFEEQLYRNTRAGRTVPGVIGGRQGAGSSSATGSGRAEAPRVSGAGKVFGQRANKGRAASQSPKLQSGSLTNTGRRSKKDTRHTWQRAKPDAPTSLPSGSLAVTRITGERPMSAEDIAAAALAERRAKRRELWKRQERGEASPIPASELFDGTEGKVTRSVISGTKPLPPVDRSEAGKRFSTYGFEE